VLVCLNIFWRMASRPAKFVLQTCAIFYSDLPFLLPDLLLPEVQEYNRQNPREEPLVEKCTKVFPYENLTGHNIIHNEKNHSIKHGGGDVAKYADIINMSCDAPEDGHKFWIKEPGGNTNQGPEAALTMMNHSLRKEASALLCEGVQGALLSSII
jgi:hypothetical protein